MLNVFKERDSYLAGHILSIENRQINKGNSMCVCAVCDCIRVCASNDCVFTAMQLALQIKLLVTLSVDDRVQTVANEIKRTFRGT